jgi:hypothetical protein
MISPRKATRTRTKTTVQHPFVLMIGSCLICLLTFGPVEGQRAEIAGTVTREGARTPLSNVRLEVVGLPRVAWTTLTGDYVLEDVPPGTYDLRVSGCDIAPQTVRLTIGTNNLRRDISSLPLTEGTPNSHSGACTLPGTALCQASQRPDLLVSRRQARSDDIGLLATALARVASEVAECVPAKERPTQLAIDASQFSPADLAPRVAATLSGRLVSDFGSIRMCSQALPPHLENVRAARRDCWLTVSALLWVRAMHREGDLAAVYVGANYHAQPNGSEQRVVASTIIVTLRLSGGQWVVVDAARESEG